jgi:hypothetical protein
MFYRRVFGVTKVFWICIGLVAGYWIAIMIAWINVCQPIHYFWFKYTTTMKGHCFDSNKYYFGNGIANMLIDVCVLAYPVPIVWKVRISTILSHSDLPDRIFNISQLQMPLEKKLAVIGILLLGSLYVAFSLHLIGSLRHKLFACFNLLHARIRSASPIYQKN